MPLRVHGFALHGSQLGRFDRPEVFLAVPFAANNKRKKNTISFIYRIRHESFVFEIKE